MLLLNNTGFAQNYSYYRNEDQYTASYYVPVLWGSNGFRTVEEENRLMEEMLAEKRRQARMDSLTSDEIAADRKRQERNLEIRKDQLEARNQKNEAKPKQREPRKDSLTADQIAAERKRNAEIKKGQVEASNQKSDKARQK